MLPVPPRSLCRVVPLMLVPHCMKLIGADRTSVIAGHPEPCNQVDEARSLEIFHLLTWKRGVSPALYEPWVLDVEFNQIQMKSARHLHA